MFEKNVKESLARKGRKEEDLGGVDRDNPSEKSLKVRIWIGLGLDLVLLKIKFGQQCGFENQIKAVIYHRFDNRHHRLEILKLNLLSRILLFS